MRSYPLYKTPFLNVDAKVEAGRVRLDAKGLMLRIPAVSQALRMIEGQIPALAKEEHLYLSTWFPPVPSKAFDRLAKSQVKSCLGIRTPDQVTISITEECPNRCRHCALPDSGHKLSLSPSQVEPLIKQSLDLGTTLIIFDGGEPSVYRELPDLVSFVDDRAVSSMFTSGAGFSQKLAGRLANAGLQTVNVSLDSPDAREHDEMRGRSGVFDDAMNAIRYSLDAGLLVDIYVVLRHDNVDRLSEFHRLAKEVGAHELTFFEVVPTGRWAGKRGVVLDQGDLTRLNDFVSSADEPRIFSVPEAFSRFGCFGGRSWMHITPGGEVYPCACLPQSFGNALFEPLSMIWNRMRRFRYQGAHKCPVRAQDISINQ